MTINLANPSSGFGIRPYELEDIPHLYQAAHESIPEMYTWMPWCHPEYNIEESRGWVQHCLQSWSEKQSYNFIIYDLLNKDFVGGVGLNDIRGTANLGYWVRTSCTGRGAASTAAQLCAQFGIRKLGLHRIEILAAVENIASQRAAEKAGAIREGVLRSRLIYHGKPHDAVVFSIIPSDYGLEVESK